MAAITVSDVRNRWHKRRQAEPLTGAAADIDALLMTIGVLEDRIARLVEQVERRS